MPFSVGETFESFKHFEERIAYLEKEEKLSLWRRDSRSIANARSKGIKRHLKPELVYYTMQYSCYHGGRQFKSHSQGCRPNQRSVNYLSTTLLRLKGYDELTVSPNISPL